MKRLLLAAFAFALVVSACNSEEPTPTATATPSIQITADDVQGSVLESTDVGNAWQKEANAVPSTVQVGGTVGPANVKDAEAEAHSAFKAKEGSGYVSDSIFLLATADTAAAVIAKHREAEATKKWTQERMDGGGSRFELKGPVNNLASLGDEMYTASLEVKVSKPEVPEVTRKIEYVVYRIDRVIGFVVAQDAGVSDYATKQEQKLTRFTS